MGQASLFTLRSLLSFSFNFVVLLASKQADSLRAIASLAGFGGSGPRVSCSLGRARREREREREGVGGWLTFM